MDYRTWWCGRRDLNPYGCPHAPQTCAYANSATTARTIGIIHYTRCFVNTKVVNSACMRSISRGMAAYALAHWRICAHYVFQGSRLSMVGKGFLPSPPLKLTKPVSRRTPERAARQKTRIAKAGADARSFAIPFDAASEIPIFQEISRRRGDFSPATAFCSPRRVIRARSSAFPPAALYFTAPALFPDCRRRPFSSFSRADP